MNCICSHALDWKLIDGEKGKGWEVINGTECFIGSFLTVIHIDLDRRSGHFISREKGATLINLRSLLFLSLDLLTVQQCGGDHMRGLWR